MLPTLEQLNGVKRFVFPPDNKTRYWMDFASWEGLPSDRVFYLKGEVSHGQLELVAMGYGLKDSYGNGSIFIDPKYLPPELEP